MGGLMRASSAELDDYSKAADELRARAALIGEAAWNEASAEGKWSPAQEIEHVVLSHELFLAQLDGGPAMRVITSGWRRIALQRVLLPYILVTGRFPRGARAPRESRPIETRGSRDVLVLRLERAVRGVIAAVQRDERAGTRRRLSHPYFGMMTVSEVVRLSTLHTRHHTARLSTGR
jgi:hypothetical protein